MSVSGNEVNINHVIESGNKVVKPKVDNTIEGNVNSINLEGKRVESNNVWKTGLNKQGNIDLAYIATSKNDKTEDKNKKNNIFEMVGNVGSVEITENNKAKEIPKDLFDNNNNKSISTNVNDTTTISEDKPNNLNNLNNDGSGNKITSGLGIKSEVGGTSKTTTGHAKEDDEFNKISVKDKEVIDKTKTNNTDNDNIYKRTNLIESKNSKGAINTYEGKDIESVEFNSKLDLNGINSKLDNNADTSDMMKWKNYTKGSIDHGNVDLTNVKSKINTGINNIKTMDSQFQKENDELKKKFAELQKEKENKIKDYREMLLKLKTEKNKEEIKKGVSLLDELIYFIIILSY